MEGAMRFRFLFSSAAGAFCLFILLAACSARPLLQRDDPDVQAARAACRGIPKADRFACIEKQAVAALNPDVCRLLSIAVDDACLQSVYEAADDPAVCERLYLPGVRRMVTMRSASSGLSRSGMPSSAENRVSTRLTVFSK